MIELNILYVSLNLIALLPIIYFAAVIFHEIGHALTVYAITRTFPVLKRKGLTLYYDCRDLNNNSFIACLFSGLLFGFLIIQLAYFLIHPVTYWLLIILYLLGSKGDLYKLAVYVCEELDE